MKQDAKITHKSNELNAENGMEATQEVSFKGNNAASVNGTVAGKEAIRSMEMNTTEKTKKTELTTGG